MGGADCRTLKAAPLLMGNRLHLTHHGDDAVTVFRIVAKIRMQIINPGVGIVFRIINHQFIHIGADLLDGDTLFDDVRKVTLYGDDACRRPPHHDLHFPVLDIQPCLYQDAVLFHCRNDHGINGGGSPSGRCCTAVGLSPAASLRGTRPPPPRRFPLSQIHR